MKILIYDQWSVFLEMLQITFKSKKKSKKKDDSKRMSDKFWSRFHMNVYWFINTKNLNH